MASEFRLKLGRFGPYVAIVGLFSSQQMLGAVLAPVAREVGLSAFQVGLIFTLSSLLVTVTSPFWGRMLRRVSSRSVLVVSLLGSALGLLIFAASISLAMAGALGGTVLFLCMLGSRSVIFGFFGAATPVAAQTYVATQTRAGPMRVRGIAAIGAAFGIAGIIGPAVGGFLSGVNVILPLYVAPGLVMAVAVLLLAILRGGAPQLPAEVDVVGRPVKPLDARIWPYLSVGLVLFFTLSIQSVLLAFVMQDRFSLTPQMTGQRVGLAFLCAGVGSLLVQFLIVSKLSIAPQRLLRIGLPVSLAGFLVLIVSPSVPVAVVGTAVVSIGHAFAIPGYTVGPTLHVSDSEQGAIAGMMASCNSAASILAPVLSTIIYTLWPNAPYVVAIGALLAAYTLVLSHPTMRPGRATVGETVSP